MGLPTTAESDMDGRIEGAFSSSLARRSREGEIGHITTTLPYYHWWYYYYYYY
jgi:hypothetical protein